MNKKRFVALLAAAVMILGTVPVYAAETSGSGTVIDEATTGALTITGDATVNDVAKPDTFVVTLPTAKAFDFYVDPYGLIDAVSGTAVDIVEEASGQGAIVVKDNALAVIKNQSNVDVVVDVNVQITATGGALTLVTDQAAVVSGDATNMFIGLVPGTTKAADENAYVATNEAIAIAQNGTEVSFLLDAATYEVYVKGDGSLGYQISPEEDNYDAVAFMLGGSINKGADWSKFTGEGSISFNVVFDIAKASTEVRATDTALYGVVSGTAVADYTAVAGTTNKAETAYVNTTASATYWYVWMDEEMDTTFPSTATVKVNGEDISWTSRTACASSLKVATMSTAFDMGGTSLDAGNYEVVVTLEDGTVYKATVTVE